jgi:hypothetical protein
LAKLHQEMRLTVRLQSIPQCVHAFNIAATRLFYWHTRRVRQHFNPHTAHAVPGAVGGALKQGHRLNIPIAFGILLIRVSKLSRRAERDDFVVCLARDIDRPASSLALKSPVVS